MELIDLDNPGAVDGLESRQEALARLVWLVGQGRISRKDVTDFLGINLEPPDFPNTLIYRSPRRLAWNI